MPALYLAATQKSSGKTTLSIGICRELRRLGHRVQPFKKGPDYIDPLWLSLAAGRDCLNLDYHTMSEGEICRGFANALADGAFGLIEGNVGLFDSVDLLGRQSNAALAKLLKAPVLLIVHAQGMSRGIAPLLLGYQRFDPDLQIAGVLLNGVGGSRHEANLRRAVEHYTDLPVFGAVHRNPALEIQERHLGLMPSNETNQAWDQVERIRAAIAEQVDIPALFELGAKAMLPAEAVSEQTSAPRSPDLRIGLARDEAFGFYYPDDLASLRSLGAELVEFSPLKDSELPPVDALFIGGGFPEYRMQGLAENWEMRAAVRDFIERGGPVYAECGGLMYLCRGLRWGKAYSPMCGVLDAEVAMHRRPQGRGYMRLRETEAFPWPQRKGGTRSEIRAHEFHHSAIVDPDPRWRYGYEVLRGTGINGRQDAVLYKNLVAGYAHLRHVGGVAWTERFVAQIRRILG